MYIDLRSDTFTKPSYQMLESMRNASVGDDVFGEDPTVNELESTAATMFGMESAVFCPSGTMTNQIAIKCHTQPGNEIICEKLSHVYIYEGGGIASNSGCQVKPIDGDRGRINSQQVLEAINSDDIHKPITYLVSIENTANRGGGSCYEINELQLIKEVCAKHEIKLHLDGARLWNAMVAKSQNPLVFGEIFDSISICLSKGLGAPIGSLLLGNAHFIKKARRVRKVFGGGMRQAGYLAAAGLYALDNNISRLTQDHAHAKMIGAALIKKDFIGKILPIETNMIIFEVTGTYTAASFAAFLKTNNILCIPISENYVRMVTHLDVTPNMITDLVSLIESM
jgi:threonine aldolase